MKKSIRTLTILIMAILLLVVAAMPVLAASFDFEAAIADFVETPLNTKTLKVGDTHSPLGSTWMGSPGVECYVSDPNVITVNNKGIVTAVGEGTAYIAFVPSEHMYEITCYKISDATSGAGTSVFESQDMIKDIINNDSSGTGSIMSGGFIAFAIIGSLFAVFFIFVVVLLIATAQKSKKLDSAMQALANNPCQATAEAAVEEFSNINALLRFNISNGSDTRGIHFTMWREVFNSTVFPCRAIRPETKDALRTALVRLNTHSLKQVNITSAAGEAK